MLLILFLGFFSFRARRHVVKIQRVITVSAGLLKKNTAGSASGKTVNTFLLHSRCTACQHPTCQQGIMDTRQHHPRCLHGCRKFYYSRCLMFTVKSCTPGEKKNHIDTFLLNPFSVVISTYVCSVVIRTYVYSYINKTTLVCDCSVCKLKLFCNTSFFLLPVQQFTEILTDYQNKITLYRTSK